MSNYDKSKVQSLPVSMSGVLAETSCNCCEGIAVVRIRKDGWPQIHCSNLECKYTEIGGGEKSALVIMQAVCDNDKTKFMRASLDAVRVIGFTLADNSPPNPQPDIELEPPAPVEVAPKPPAPEVDGLNKMKSKKAKSKKLKTTEDDLEAFHAGI